MGAIKKWISGSVLAQCFADMVEEPSVTLARMLAAEIIKNAKLVEFNKWEESLSFNNDSFNICTSVALLKSGGNHRPGAIKRWQYFSLNERTDFAFTDLEKQIVNEALLTAYGLSDKAKAIDREAQRQHKALDIIAGLFGSLKNDG